MGGGGSWRSSTDIFDGGSGGGLVGDPGGGSKCNSSYGIQYTSLPPECSKKQITQTLGGFGYGGGGSGSIGNLASSKKYKAETYSHANEN